MERVVIREAKIDDAHSIAQVHVASWRSAYVDLMPSDFLASLTTTLSAREAQWTRAIERKDADILVAEVEGKVVGWISVGPCRDEDTSEAKAGEVMAIYLLSDDWGKGIGTALWKAGMKRLHDQGYRNVTLWVLSANERALRFYQGLGGKEDMNSRRTLVRGGVTLGEVRYVWVS